MTAEFVDTGVCEYVDDPAYAKDLCEEFIEEDEPIAIDTETTGLNIVHDTILVWSASNGGERWCFTLDMLDPMEPFLTSNVVKILTNAKYDAHMLANHGILMGGAWWDTLVLDWLFDENRLSHKLDACAKDYGILKNTKSFKETFGPWYEKKYGKKTIPKDGAYLAIEAAPREVTAEYASADAWKTYWVAMYLIERLKGFDIRRGYSSWDYYQEIEVPFTHILWKMERAGFQVNLDHFRALQGPMEKHMEKLTRPFFLENNGPINLKSTHQLREFFFDYDEGSDTWEDPFGRPPEVWTSGGKSGIKYPSTDESVLKAWAEEGDEYATLLLEHRHFAKIKGTYVDGPLKKGNTIDGRSRIHTTLNQGRAVTGRLSSSDPNLQNVPIRNDEFHIRAGWVAEPGKILYDPDYSSLEMRIAAHISDDPAMIRAINEGLDLHCFTVSHMGMGATYEEMIVAKRAEHPTDAQVALLSKRSEAKAVGFGVLYGKMAVSLAEDLGLEVIEDTYRGRDGKLRTKRISPAGQALIDSYFDVFPRLQEEIDYTIRSGRRNGLVRTITGRPRRLPDLMSSKFWVRARAERQAFNARVQGSAAEIVKYAMLKIAEDERLRELGVVMIMQIHDELIFEMDDDEEVKQEAKLIIDDKMGHPFSEDLKVALKVDGKFGYSWEEAH